MNSRLNLEDPLQNINILSTIFSFCSVEDLKNCRLVGSRLWLKATLNLWRENAVLKIYHAGMENGGISLQEAQRITEDENDPIQFRRKTFRNVKLEGFDFLNLLHSDLDVIFDKFSFQMRYLAFKKCEFTSLSSFLRAITVRFPNLVELKLENRITFRDGGVVDFQCHEQLKRITFQLGASMTPAWFPIRDLLMHFPKVEHLQILPPHEDNGKLDALTHAQIGKRVMGAVAAIRRQDSSKLRIKNLDVVTVPYSAKGFMGETEDTLAFAGMPLERFAGTTNDLGHVMPFAQTLKFLNVTLPDENSSVGSDDNGMMSFPNLKEVNLDGSPANAFRALNKLEAFNLETLLVDDVDYFNHSNRKFFNRWPDTKINLNNPSFGNVTKLECYNMNKMYVVNLQGFQSLSFSMPNVKHVRMPMTRKAFRKLCSTWPNLLTLSIPYRNMGISRIDDETITGIKPEPGSKTVAAGTRPPNITDLKLLTDFVCSARLTAYSVHYGFLQMPRLRYLNVKLSGVSEEGISALRKQVNFLEARIVK